MICAAVIPCLNECTGIAALVSALRQQVSLVVVVDDGSTDDTASRAKGAGAFVVKHERNLGKGAALKTGLSLALKQGYEWAVTLDGDGQHAPEDLPALLRCAEETGAPLIIGNRMGAAHAMPWFRRLVNRWMSWKLSQCAGRQLPDTQSGFRLIRLEAWAALSLNTEHFEIESEMLMAFLAAEHPVAFVPIQVISRSRSSHIRPVTDSLRWWKWWRNFGRLPTSRHPPNSAVQESLPVVAQTEMHR